MAGVKPLPDRPAEANELISEGAASADGRVATQRTVLGHTLLQPATRIGTRVDDWGAHALVPTDWKAGLRVGPFLLKQPLGEGAMGMVWLAEQQEPLVREVALKVTLQGEHGKLIDTYFEIERQALARLSHRAIAQIYDAGKLPNGALFFAMEYVPGMPLHHYLAANKTDPRVLAQLMVDVCQGIQHAHQRGLIHRDIKPGNILVLEVDRTLQAKVIDFGIAVASSSEGVTRVRDVAGTESYMSPEQREPGADGIDARADVYSLGAVLAESLYLLLGLKTTHRGAASTTWRQELRSSLNASFWLTDQGASGSKVSPAPGAVPPIVNSKSLAKLPVELRAIAIKALAPSPDARYESAAAMADDLQNWLQKKPVQAMRGGMLYRVRCFLRRYWLASAAASVVAVSLIAGLAVALYGLRQAEQSLAFAQKGNAILGAVFAGLDPSKSYASVGEFSQTLKDNLAGAVKELDGTAIGDPLVVADMQLTLGRSLIGLGDFQSAVELLEKSVATRSSRLGLEHPDTLASLSGLAEAYRREGKYDLALPLYEKALALRKAKLGPDHPDTLASMSGLADGYYSVGEYGLAVALDEQTLALHTAKLGPDHPETLRSMNNLAVGYFSDGKYDLAVPLYEQTLALRKAKLGPDHPETLRSMRGLAAGYLSVGKADLALPLLEKTVALHQAKVGPDHPNTLASMSSLANAYRLTGRFDLAVALSEQALALLQARVGPDYPDTLASMSILAAAYALQGKVDLAVALSEDALALYKAKLGPDHPDTLASMNNLAVAYAEVGKFDLAVALAEQALALQKARFGSGHPFVLRTMHQYAVALLEVRRSAEAVPLFEELIAAHRKAYHAEPAKLAAELARIAAALIHGGLHELAEPMLRESLAIRSKAEPDAWQTFNTQSLLGAALLGQKRYADAEVMLLRGYEGLKAREQTPGEMPIMVAFKELRIPEALDRLIVLYQATNNPREVRKYQALRAGYATSAWIRTFETADPAGPYH